MLDKIIVNKLLIKFGDAGAVNSSRTKENVDVVNDLGGYSLSSVARTPRLMSYDILRTDDTTYSRRVS